MFLVMSGVNWGYNQGIPLAHFFNVKEWLMNNHDLLPVYGNLIIEGGAEPSGSSSLIPPLRIGLLGGFVANRTPYPLDYESLSRYTVQTLLSILVLSGDREINSSHICGILWPETSADKSKRSLYTLWSLLRRSLMLPDKQCPYLERRNSSCRLVGRYVISDVQTAGELCDKLRFDCRTPDDIVRVARQLQTVYRGELLPGEESNGLILRKRWEWRNRVVEAFAHAARLLYKKGCYHEAIWLACSATTVDPAREDVAMLLMRCYLAVGAKAAAIQVFNELRQYLMVQLAISPSEAITTFFNAIISDEELPDDFWGDEEYADAAEDALRGASASD